METVGYASTTRLLNLLPDKIGATKQDHALIVVFFVELANRADRMHSDDLNVAIGLLSQAIESFYRQPVWAHMHADTSSLWVSLRILSREFNARSLPCFHSGELLPSCD